MKARKTETRIAAIATDYDGTIAQHGDVLPSTRQALEQLKADGLRVLLVTGRELNELKQVCPFTNLFDRVVAENGALVHNPDTAEIRMLAPAPPRDFTERLRERGVAPLAVGRVIVATQEINLAPVQETIEEMKLPLHVSMNKGSVMVLPDGVNKAAGLEAALEEIGLSSAEVAGVGDAENDYSFLEICGLSAAVGNALPGLKARVDWVATGTHGAGVEELFTELRRKSAENQGKLGRS